MGGTAVATVIRSGVLSAAEPAQNRPLGLGSSTLPHQPLGLCPRGPRTLRRQWTTAKPGRGQDVRCNVLPFFLDLSLAFAPGMEFFDAVKSSVDSEVVFQATLQVPAHHALACRLNAYGTPFAAPDLQAAAHELRDEDLEFAACLATPPDLDEQLSVNFGRVMSMLEKNQGQAGGQIATRAAATRGAGAGGSSAGTVQQQLRSTQPTSQVAPKVLVSVDEAETTAAQLQRVNSAKKQPKLLSLMDGYGKRALQALLGVGYFLTVLHEKSLGGRIEFSAALTAANIISPAMSDDANVRARDSSTSGGGALGVLAGLRQLMRDCPSLSPLSPHSSINARRTSAAAAAAAAARAVAAVDGGSGVVVGSMGSGGLGGSAADTSCSPSSTPTRRPNLASSFEAAWDHVLHPPLLSSSGGLGGASFGSSSSSSRGGGGAAAAAAARVAAAVGAPATCQGLQLQLSLSAPCRRMSMDWSGSTPGSTPRTPLSLGLQQQQQQQQQQEAEEQEAAFQQGPFAAAAAAAGGGGSMPAAPGRGSSPLSKMSGGVLQANRHQQQQQQREQDGQEVVKTQEELLLLHKTQDLGRGSDMDTLIDGAIEQLQEQRLEASATDLVSLVEAGQSVFARPTANGAAAAAADEDGGVGPSAGPSSPPKTPAQLKPPPQQQQQQPVTPGGLRSFYLHDQGPLTSPLGTSWAGTSGAAAGAGAAFRPPAHLNSSSPWGPASAGRDSSTAGGVGASGTTYSSSGSSVPGTPQRMLLPVMSMRLTCQPAWQYNNGGTASADGGTPAAADRAQGNPTPNGVTQGGGGIGGGAAAATAAAGGQGAAADVSGPSLTLSDFIAAADAATDRPPRGSSSSASAVSAAHKPAAVQMHQPTQAELHARAQGKLAQQQAQTAAAAAAAAAGEAEDEFDDSALMASPVSFSLPNGLWPTMSFSLVPVRLPPASPKSPAGFRTSNASCSA